MVLFCLLVFGFYYLVLLVSAKIFNTDPQNKREKESKEIMTEKAETIHCGRFESVVNEDMQIIYNPTLFSAIIIRICPRFIIFCTNLATFSIFLTTFELAIRKERKDILLINLTITTWVKRANLQYWDCNPKGGASPYLQIACNEPRDVWRMSAPLVLIN